MVKNVQEWAENQFKHCDLKDARRTKRLTKIAQQLSEKVGSSLLASCNGDGASIEASYRFLSNPKTTSEAIREGVFKASQVELQKVEEVLAIEDTTSFSFRHQTIKSLGPVGDSKKTKKRGFYAHSVLLVDRKKQRTIGLIEQTTWQREEGNETRELRRQRDYKDKESFNWEEASSKIAHRLGDDMKKVISVCDKEADIFDYLNYKVANNQRFIIRAYQNRKLKDCEVNRIRELADVAEILGEYSIKIQQKSGRKARIANIEVRSARICIHQPDKRLHKDQETKLPISLNVIFAKEKNKAEDPASWMLLTSEPIDTIEDCFKIVNAYAMRWRIEEYHKAWKSGAGAEEQRSRSANNLEKMVCLLGVVAIRLLQLREAITLQDNYEVTNSIHCTEIFTKEEYAVLVAFMKTVVGPKSRLASHPHNLRWAYIAVGKLGGWGDTQNTGVASWQTIWNGWFRLQERVAGLTIDLIGQKM